jgi:hypothetical protein
MRAAMTGSPDLCRDAYRRISSAWLQAGGHVLSLNVCLQRPRWRISAGGGLLIGCDVCSAAGQAVDLIAASRAADSAYTEWRRVNRTGLRHVQEARRPLYERTTAFKIYVSTVMPGLVQTPGYAKALMSAITAFRETLTTLRTPLPPG